MSRNSQRQLSETWFCFILSKEETFCQSIPADFRLPHPRLKLNYG